MFTGYSYTLLAQSFPTPQHTDLDKYCLHKYMQYTVHSTLLAIAHFKPYDYL